MKKSLFVRPAVEIALLYGVLAWLWDAYIEQPLTLLGLNRYLTAQERVIEQWAFSLCTALLLYLLLRRALLARDRAYARSVASSETAARLSEAGEQLAAANARLKDQTAALQRQNAELAELYSQAQRLAVLEERQRLARELHDSVSQTLYSIALGARTARAQLERDPSQACEPLDYVLSLADTGLTEMRALIFELRPESLEREGLVAALGRQAALMRSRYGIQVRVDVCAEPDLPFPVKEAFYRIAQEALNNTARHAHAACVDVSLCGDEQGMALEVRDDGAGFDPDVSFPGHLGLHTMRERATALGGTLEISSREGQGTVIRACLPTVLPR